MADNAALSRSPFYWLSVLTLTQLPLHQPVLIVVFWTLCYEAAFYGVVFLLLLSGKIAHLSRDGFLTTLHLVTFLSLTTLIVRPTAALFPFDLWPQFGLGVLAYDLISQRQTKRQATSAAAVLAAFLTFAALRNYGGGIGHASSRLQSITCLVFFVLLLLLHPLDLRLRKTAVVRLASAVGAFSYSLYLIHVPAMGLASQFVSRFHPGQSTFLLEYFLAILVAVIAGYVFYRLCEKPLLMGRPAAERSNPGKGAHPSTTVLTGWRFH